VSTSQWLTAHVNNRRIIYPPKEWITTTIPLHNFESLADSMPLSLKKFLQINYPIQSIKTIIWLGRVGRYKVDPIDLGFSKEERTSENRTLSSISRLFFFDARVHPLKVLLTWKCMEFGTNHKTTKIDVMTVRCACLCACVRMETLSQSLSTSGPSPSVYNKFETYKQS